MRKAEEARGRENDGMMLDLWFKRRGTGHAEGLEMLILHTRGRRPNMKQKNPPIDFWGGTWEERKIP